MTKPKVLVIYPDHLVETLYVSGKDAQVSIRGIQRLVRLDDVTAPYDDEDGRLPFDWSYRCLRMDVRPGDYVFVDRLSSVVCRRHGLNYMTDRIYMDDYVATDEDDKRELERAVKGPLFISLRREESGEFVTLPDKFISYVRDVVAGHKYIIRADHPRIIFKDDLIQMETGQHAVSVSTTFFDSFRCDKVMASVSLIVFEPKGTNSGSVTATLFAAAIHRALSKYGRNMGHMLRCILRVSWSSAGPLQPRSLTRLLHLSQRNNANLQHR